MLNLSHRFQILEKVKVFGAGKFSRSGELWWPYLSYNLFDLYRTWTDEAYCDTYALASWFWAVGLGIRMLYTFLVQLPFDGYLVVISSFFTKLRWMICIVMHMQLTALGLNMSTGFESNRTECWRRVWF